MKAVVDTDVVAHLLLGTEPFGDEARLCFEHVATPLAPAHWEAEVTNDAASAAAAQDRTSRRRLQADVRHPWLSARRTVRSPSLACLRRTSPTPETAND